MKRMAFRADRDVRDDHLEETRDKMNKSMDFTVLAEIGGQISLRWSASGLIADSILGESMLEDLSIFEDLIPKLFGSGFTNLENFSLSDENNVAYYRTMLDAMTVKLDADQITHAADTIRNFRYPSAWPGPENDIDITTASEKIGTKTGGGEEEEESFKGEITYVSDEEEEKVGITDVDVNDNEIKPRFSDDVVKKRDEITLKKVREDKIADEVAMKVGRMVIKAAGLSPLTLKESDQRKGLDAVADVVMSTLFTLEKGGIPRGQTVIFNRKEILKWLKKNGRDMANIIYAKIAFEWILKNPKMLIFVRQGLTPGPDRLRVVVGTLAFIAVFGAIFFLLSKESVKSYDIAQTELVAKRKSWWAAFKRKEDQTIITTLLGKEVIDTKKDAFAFRKLLIQKKTSLLNTLSGMNYEQLSKPENLGWFKGTKYENRVSMHDVWVWSKSWVGMDPVEISDVEDLLTKFSKAVDSITQNYIENDEMVAASMGDAMWNYIRGFLMSAMGEKWPTGWLETTALAGYPIGGVGLAAGLGGLVGYIAFHVASATVIWGYTGDSTAYREAFNNSVWIMKKSFHLLAIPVILTGISKMLGSFSFLLSSWGLFAAISAIYLAPGVGGVLVGITGMAWSATRETAIMVATANKKAVYTDPRLIAVQKTYMEENQALLDELEKIRLEYIGMARKDSRQAIDLATKAETLRLTLLARQDNTNNKTKLLLENSETNRTIKSLRIENEKLIAKRTGNKKKYKKLKQKSKQLLITLRSSLSPSQRELLQLDWKDNVSVDPSPQGSDLAIMPRPNSSIHDNPIPEVTSALPYGPSQFISVEKWVKRDDVDEDDEHVDEDDEHVDADGTDADVGAL